MNDLASGTSSWSTKLVHGGLRYLEYYEFRLVREALIEREILWQIAPHIIRPLRFVLPHHAGLRPAWLLRLGLFLYDHIGGRHLLPPTRSVDLTRDEVGKPLIAEPLHQGLRIFRLFRRRRPPCGAHRARRRRSRRRNPHPFPRGRDPAGRRHLAGHGRKHGQRRALAPSVPARWSMPAARGSSRCWPRARASMRAPRCGWCRARTSWCASSMSTTAPTCSRTPTAASCSQFPIRTISR